MNSSALLREADIRGWVSVAPKFMRSSVAREHGRPLRWAKLYFRKVLAAVFSGAALSVASVGIENEDGAVSAGDLDRLAGSGALVEEVETRLRIVVGDPFADRLPGRFDGLEGLDVEGRVGWRREVDDALPEAVEAEEELIQGRPTALHPCGACHPLRGFLSKTPTSLRRFSTCPGRRTPPMVFIGVLQRGQRAGSAPQT